MQKLFFVAFLAIVPHVSQADTMNFTNKLTVPANITIITDQTNYNGTIEARADGSIEYTGTVQSITCDTNNSFQTLKRDFSTPLAQRFLRDSYEINRSPIVGYKIILATPKSQDL